MNKPQATEQSKVAAENEMPDIPAPYTPSGIEIPAIVTADMVKARDPGGVYGPSANTRDSARRRKLIDAIAFCSSADKQASR
jgi:hypothetical protein